MYLSRIFSCAKGYMCYCPTIRRYFVSTNVAFFETTPFSDSSTITSQREDDDLLVYYVFLPVPTPAPIPVKTLITQVYSRCQKLVVSSPTPIASTLDPVFSNDFPIALRKGKRQRVHPQFPHFVLITIFHHIPILLLHP